MKVQVAALIILALFLLPVGLPIGQADAQISYTSEAVRPLEVAQQQPACPGFLTSRLTPNSQGRVLPGLPNRLREQPSTSSRVLGLIPAGRTFNVIVGPVCDPIGAAWWQVTYNGRTGWTMEGQGGAYWLEPYSACPMTPRLTVGSPAVVTPGQPNTIRSQAGSGSTLGQIPGGATFTVVGGPLCVSAIWWWQVQYGSVIGWTGEGQNGQYWLMPLATCYNAPPARLSPGMQAQVTPGLPNTVRSQPAGGSTLGQIPGGASFTVLAGPQCGSDGRLWWQVNYNNLVGWTAEGEGTTYWLQPDPNVTVCQMTSRVTVGISGQVTPGLPNALRTQAGSGQVIGYIPAGGFFRVIGGPQCVSGVLWWQVQYGAMTGWTGEGQSGVYWVTPLICAASPASRLVPGMQARVTPGLPNAMRTLPGAGQVNGQIPSGAYFTITGAPQCGSDGRLWWPVNYAGIVGWTAEGEGATYWLEP